MKGSIKNNITKYNVLDLFCGCGGFPKCFDEAQYKILIGLDNWQVSLDTFWLLPTKVFIFSS